MQLLKLVALDKEDLDVFSAHLQDAVMRVGDLSYLPGERRFVAIVNRFDWAKAESGAAGEQAGYERRRAAVRFEHVLGLKRLNISQATPEAVLSLLSIVFEPTTAPSGHVTLVFAGGGVLRLEVDYIEAELRDLGPVWSTAHRPDHADADPPARGSGGDQS